MRVLAAHWSLTPPGWAVVALVAWYVAGGLSGGVLLRRGGRGRSAWEAASVLAGCGVASCVLDGPIGYYSTSLFWVDTVGYLLLTAVAAPLIVVGAPWEALAGVVPEGWRRRIAGSARSSLAGGLVRGLGRGARLPALAMVAYVAAVWAWHMPVPFDLALSSPAALYGQQLSFLVVAVGFWLQVADSRPLRSHLPDPGRLLFLAVAAAQNWVLSMYIYFSPGPLYAGYAHLAHRPEQITALQDQIVGAGILWLPGQIPIATAAVFVVFRWVRQHDERDMDEELASLLASEDTRPDGRGGSGSRRPRLRLELAPRHRLR